MKIIQKPLFFLGFCNILKKSLEVLGTPWGTLWERLGNTLGGLGNALEGLGNALEGLGNALEGLGNALGDPSRRTLGIPWGNL